MTFFPPQIQSTSKLFMSTTLHLHLELIGKFKICLRIYYVTSNLLILFLGRTPTPPTSKSGLQWPQGHITYIAISWIGLCFSNPQRGNPIPIPRLQCWSVSIIWYANLWTIKSQIHSTSKKWKPIKKNYKL